MLDNCCYNKIKLTHELNRMHWFIEKHAMEDAKKQNDTRCITLLNDLNQELKKQLEKLNGMFCEHTQ